MATEVPTPRPKSEPKAKPRARPEFPRTPPIPDSEFATDFGRAPRVEPPAPVKRTPSMAKLERKVEELFSALALPFALAGDEHCAGIIARGAPSMTAAWLDLADQNPGVKRVLVKLTEGSAWGGVILSTAAVAIPIAAHHGAPLGSLSGMFGAPPRPIPMPAAENGSSMGAPAPMRDPVPYGTATDFMPRVPGSPEGVVTVGDRNRAGATGANGAAAV